MKLLTIFVVLVLANSWALADKDKHKEKKALDGIKKATEKEENDFELRENRKIEEKTEKKDEKHKKINKNDEDEDDDGEDDDKLQCGVLTRKSNMIPFLVRLAVSINKKDRQCLGVVIGNKKPKVLTTAGCFAGGEPSNVQVVIFSEQPKASAAKVHNMRLNKKDLKAKKSFVRLSFKDSVSFDLPDGPIEKRCYDPKHVAAEVAKCPKSDGKKTSKHHGEGGGESDPINFLGGLLKNVVSRGKRDTKRTMNKVGGVNKICLSHSRDNSTVKGKYSQIDHFVLDFESVSHCMWPHGQYHVTEHKCTKEMKHRNGGSKVCVKIQKKQYKSNKLPLLIEGAPLISRSCNEDGKLPAKHHLVGMWTAAGDPASAKTSLKEHHMLMFDRYEETK